jgi:outer membrane protein assembly factor BamB
VLACADALTGKRVYRQRIDPSAGSATASPLAYNGKIFVLNEDGDTFVIEAGDTFKVLRKNSLGGAVRATPAVVRGSMLIRTVSDLYRIAKPAP